MICEVHNRDSIKRWLLSCFNSMESIVSKTGGHRYLMVYRPDMVKRYGYHPDEFRTECELHLCDTQINYMLPEESFAAFVDRDRLNDYSTELIDKIVRGEIDD